MKQNLSSLMDGELDDAASTQCIRALDADPELKAAWNEYHLIGDAIRGSALLSVDVRTEVGQALQQEPTVLAPKPTRRTGV
ncbi:sigma-E factor negative regulatory protein [Vogesella fluminis]|uniref:sigma-E factor negative regulatory protein n=1 Tax=Vogesella fluminis TaxID=1069161 RepID=UPI00362F8BE1